MTKAHTGDYLALKVAESLREYGLIHSILGMTLDNASNNDRMLKELPHLLPATATVGTDYQIRCFGHILNLCVKAFLVLFDTSKKARKADGDTVEEEKEDEDESEDDSAPEDDDEDVVEDEEGERDAGDWAEIEELSGSLAEVTALTTKDKEVGRCTMVKVCSFFFLKLSLILTAS